MAKIPPHAKKVFEGVIYDVYQWEQEQFDGSFRTFEMLKRPNTVIVVPLVGDKIYLHKEEQPGHAPHISVPAGRFDPGETDPLLVAKRELLEESGYTSDDFRLLRSRDFSGKIEGTTYVVVAHNCKKVADFDLDPGERIHETMLVSFDQFLEMSQHPEFLGGGELEVDCLKSIYDPEYKERFRQAIFGV
jgi:ADP-ribose pyrophosphatase